MRILLISHTCQSATEGLPKAEQLGRLPGVELCVLVPDRWFHYGQWREPAPRPKRASYRLEVGRVRCAWAGQRVGFYLHHYVGLDRLIRDFKPDVIDLWEEPYGLVSLQACRARRRSAPDALILTETEQNISKRLPPPFNLIRSRVLAQADWAVGRSQGAVDVIRRKGYKGPATVVPNAVDTGLFRPMDRQSCRDRWGMPDGFVVGYAGRLVEEKGVEDLLSAVGACPPAVSLVLAGDGPLRPAAERAAAAAGLAGRVRFLGELTPPDLSTVMNAVDVLALPSRTTPRWKEQFGRVIIEAHACQTPVIGTASGAIPQVIGGGGRVVPERSPAELAKAICDLYADPQQARRMGTAGQAQAHVYCTWERVAGQMRDVYQQMLDAGPTRTPAPAAAHGLSQGATHVATHAAARPAAAHPPARRPVPALRT